MFCLILHKKGKRIRIHTRKNFVFRLIFYLAHYLKNINHYVPVLLDCSFLLIIFPCLSNHEIALRLLLSRLCIQKSKEHNFWIHTAQSYSDEQKNFSPSLTCWPSWLQTFLKILSPQTNLWWYHASKNVKIQTFASRTVIKQPLLNCLNLKSILRRLWLL
jgi:hypothetical protein